MTVYPILQSGFVALSAQGLTKKKPQAPTFSDTILGHPDNHDYDNLHYSDDVTELFNCWRTNAMVINDHEFRKKVMLQAINLFGPSIKDWLQFQAFKPSFSISHRQFLAKFISVFLPREFDATQCAEVVRWVGLLGPTQGQRQDLYLYDLSAGYEFPEKTTDAILNIASRVGGYGALLNFMFVIFGQRVGFIQSTGAEYA